MDPVANLIIYDAYQGWELVCTFFDHLLSAGTTFFGRLEDELHCALQLILPLLEELGASQQHGHVAVMSTCM